MTAKEILERKAMLILIKFWKSGLFDDLRPSEELVAQYEAELEKERRAKIKEKAA